MVTINRKALDLSHHNSVTSWVAVADAGIIGIIHKSTEGMSYVDGLYVLHRTAALRAGLLWGAYHFGNNSNVEAQVNHFLSIVGTDAELLYALDWEDDPRGNTMTLDSARRFLQLMDERIGKNRCVVYSGNVAKEALGQRDDEFFGSHRLWLAQYGPNPVAQRSWDKIWLHQYSDGLHGPQPHGCPGVSGEVDTNSWDGTDQELRDQWSGASVVPSPEPEPEPEVPSVDIVTTGQVRIFVNGKAVS